MRGFFRSKAMKHQVNHGEVDEVFAGLRIELVVFAEPSVAAEPGERPLDDPAMRQDLEALGLVAPLDDFHDPTGELLDPRLERPGLRSVGPERFQHRALETDFLDPLFRSDAILHAGGVNHHAHDPSERVHKDRTFAPLDFLARVVAPLRPPFSPVFTDWESIMAAVGWASRPSFSRSRSWSLS